MCAGAVVVVSTHQVGDVGAGSDAAKGDLPTDFLKLDRWFVTDIADSAPFQAIVSLTVAHAKQLTLDVLAADIETAGRQQMLEGIRLGRG